MTKKNGQFTWIIVHIARILVFELELFLSFFLIKMMCFFFGDTNLILVSLYSLNLFLKFIKISLAVFIIEL